MPKTRFAGGTEMGTSAVLRLAEYWFSTILV